MVQSVFSDSGCFFAVLYMCAAHRAILTGRLIESDDGVNDSELRDPDYYMLKDRCIHEMKTKLRDPAQKASNEALQLAVSLLTGAVRILFFFFWSQHTLTLSINSSLSVSSLKFECTSEV